MPRELFFSKTNFIGHHCCKFLCLRHQILQKKILQKTPAGCCFVLTCWCGGTCLWGVAPAAKIATKPVGFCDDVAMILTWKEERCTSKRKGTRKSYLGIVSSCWMKHFPLKLVDVVIDSLVVHHLWASEAAVSGLPFGGFAWHIFTYLPQQLFVPWHPSKKIININSYNFTAFSAVFHFFLHFVRKKRYETPQSHSLFFCGGCFSLCKYLPMLLIIQCRWGLESSIVISTRWIFDHCSLQPSLGRALPMWHWRQNLWTSVDVKLLCILYSFQNDVIVLNTYLVHIYNTWYVYIIYI